MILNIDVTGKDFVVTRAPQPKLDQRGDQRFDKVSELPIWTTQVVVTDDDGGDIININTSGERPDLEVADQVEVTGLIAIPWSATGKSGVSYRATQVKAMD